MLWQTYTVFARLAYRRPGPSGTGQGARQPRAKGVKTDKVIIAPGQMKLFYVLEGTVALHYNGDVQHLESGDSAYLDGGTPHGWENLGTRSAKAQNEIDLPVKLAILACSRGGSNREPLD